MFGFLRTLFSAKPADQPEARSEAPNGPPPALIAAPGVAPFDLVGSLQYVNDLPAPDWDALWHWNNSIPEESERQIAWSTCEVAWLQHLQQALGTGYRLRRKDTAVLLSSLDETEARATLEFMRRTLARIVRLLDGIAASDGYGNDILIVLDDETTYYRYVDRFYPGEGEFAASSGMHIGTGCSHFVTMKNDLRAVEPVIAHEMTHACLAHLPIPAWLNEGIAVNTEHRLCPQSAPLHSTREMHEKHRRFWQSTEIQEFWSGKSFLRNDDGNMLSYDLARILVTGISTQWPRFRAFVLAAHLDDAGAAAAREHLDVDLGAMVSALLERGSASEFHPDPGTWHEAPEPGAFHPSRVTLGRDPGS